MNIFSIFQRKCTSTANINSSALEMFRDEMERNLAERKTARKIEQRRASQAYWAKQRKVWANDPLRVQA